MAQNKVEYSVRLRKLRQGEKGEDGVNGEDAWVVQCDPASVLVNRKGLTEKIVNITSFLGSTQLPYGGQIYPNWSFLNNINGIAHQSGFIDGWIRWSETQTANSFQLKLNCFGIDEDKSTTLRCTVRLSKSATEFVDRELLIPVTTFKDGEKGDKGDKGDDGPAGLTYRKTLWMPDVEYRNDEALLGETSDVCYLDIVVKTDDKGAFKGAWRCRETHTSTADNDPERETPQQEGDSITEHWEKLSNPGPIYSPLILADGAVIGFMQGNQLKILDADNNVVAGISAASGNSPIIYANPQKSPIRVDVAYYASTSPAEFQIEDTSEEWETSLIIPQYRYLHFRFAVMYSDDSVAYETRWGRWFNRSSSITTNSWSCYAEFTASTNNVIVESDGVITREPHTSLDYPYLWVRIHLSDDNITDWFCIGNQSSSERPQDSQYQQFANGNAQFGQPNGAKVLINAAPKSGLPKIEVYDENGMPSAIFDGTNYADINQVFSGSTSTGNVNSQQLNLYLGGEASPSDTVSAMSLPMVCQTPAVLSVTSCSFRMWGSTSETAKGENGLYAVGTVYVDNEIRARYALALADGEAVDFSHAIEFSMPALNIPVSAGTHFVRVELSADLGGNGIGQAHLQIDSPGITATLASNVQRCLYFANGLVIGSTTTNYFMAWNDGTNMQFACENTNCGLRVTNNGVQIKRNPTVGWVDL